MDIKRYSKREVVQILNDAKSAADRRADLNIIGPDEAKGWTNALINVAKRFMVEDEYIDGIPPQETAEPNI